MFKEFFSEVGSASMTRLTSFMLVCTAMAVQIVVMYLGLTTHGTLINGVYIPADTGVIEALNYATYGLLAFGLSAKVIQKFGEKSNVDITPKGA